MGKHDFGVRKPGQDGGRLVGWALQGALTGSRAPVRIRTVKRHAIRVARISAGGLLLLIGIIGGFIPVLQGWVFILAGLAVMAPESEWARRALDWARDRVRRVQERKETGSS